LCVSATLEGRTAEGLGSEIGRRDDNEDGRPALATRVRVGFEGICGASFSGRSVLDVEIPRSLPSSSRSNIMSEKEVRCVKSW